jgi:hypothetical protein
MSKSNAAASHPYTTSLAAAAAIIVTLSLVTAPPNVDSATTGSHTTAVNTTAIRLAAAVTAASLVPTSVTHPAASRSTTAAGVPPINVADGLTLIARIALGVVVVPIWYLAFPLTLPLSYFFAQGLIGFSLQPSTPQQLLQATLEIFLAGPFFVVSELPAAASASQIPLSSAGTPAASGIQTTPSTAKAHIGAAAPIPSKTLTPKPLTATTTGTPALATEKPSRTTPLAHSGLSRTASTSISTASKKP